MEQLTLRQNTDTAHPQDVVPIYFFHTLEHPFCSLPRCWCHANQQEIGQLLEESNHGMLIIREAANFAHGKTAGEER
jgi:hypothetical protein